MVLSFRRSSRFSNDYRIFGTISSNNLVPCPFVSLPIPKSSARVSRKANEQNSPASRVGDWVSTRLTDNLSATSVETHCLWTDYTIRPVLQNSEICRAWATRPKSGRAGLLAAVIWLAFNFPRGHHNRAHERTSDDAFLLPRLTLQTSNKETGRSSVWRHPV